MASPDPRRSTDRVRENRVNTDEPSAEQLTNDAGARESPPAPSGETASIARNTALALLTKLTTGFFTAGLLLYLVRALGPDSFGVFALATGLGEIAFLLADFGIPYSTSRFLAESRNDRAAIAALLADALRLKLLTAALVAGGFFAAAGPLAAAYDKPALVWTLRGVAVAVFGMSVMMLYVNAFIGLARIAVNLRVIFFESLMETAASVALVALGGGVVGAAFGRAIGYLFGALVAVAIVGKLFGSAAFRREKQSGRARQIARYAAPLLVTNSAYTLYAQVDVLIIGALLGTTAVGLFSAPARIVIPLTYVGQAVANSVAPRQARTGREPRSVEAFQASLRWLVIYQSILLAPIIIWAGPIVRLLLGSAFHGSTNVLRALALFIFLRGLGPLISTTVNYLGQAARRIPIVLGALVVNVIIDLALLPRIGVVGAAIGTGIAYSLYVPAHFRICRRELGIRLRPLALTLFRALLAASGMGVVLFATGTGTLSLARWLIGGIGGLAAFAVVLLLSGEISGDEIRRGRRAMAANLSRLVSFALR
jgi:O-antigen/teichoic acid export membrane protein